MLNYIFVLNKFSLNFEGIIDHSFFSAKHTGTARKALYNPVPRENETSDPMFFAYIMSLFCRAGFQDWPFLTVFCWGENPKGTWELEVQNDGRSQVPVVVQ